MPVASASWLKLCRGSHTCEGRAKIDSDNDLVACLRLLLEQRLFLLALLLLLLRARRLRYLGENINFEPP